MEARMQASATVVPTWTRQKVVNVIAVIWVAIHAVWFSGSLIAPDHDFPAVTYFVNTGTLVIGLAGLAGLRANKRWGWWTMVAITTLLLLITMPEVFGLPGILRVVSIVATLVLATTMLLLFRPGVRPAKG